MSAQAVVEHEEPALPAVGGSGSVQNLTPMQMAYSLIQNGADLGSVKEMLAMSRELAAEEAKRAFDTAMSAAKAEIPVIVKNRQVGFASKKPGASNTSYRHEDLGEVARTVDPILAKHGLSYRFRPEQNGATLKITCILSHRDGHSEENSLSAGNDASGNKNSIQAVGSTGTYLQRYTLKMALGLAASADDDGAASEKPEDPPLNENQIMDLQALVQEVGANPAILSKRLGVEYLDDLPQSRLKEAVAMCEAKRGQS